MDLIYGVTTYNRLSMLKNNIESWNDTKNNNHNWTLIICDDGSTDGTKEYIQNLNISKIKITKHFNNRIGIGPQINKIFRESTLLKYQYGFRSDDDVVFIRNGWDSLYINAVRRSGFDFLCFFDTNWAYKYWNKEIVRPSKLTNPNRYIQSCVKHSNEGMGAFFTFTPNLIRRVGYFDTKEIGIFGSEHVDYTIRCCRIRANDHRNLWDAYDSEKYIKLEDKEYQSSITEEEKLFAMNLVDNNLKLEKINDRKRIYIPYQEPIMNMTGKMII